MKRLLLALSLASMMALPAFASVTAPVKTHAIAAKPTARAAAHAKPHKAVTAPADEYFGHQKFSILGIRNALHDLNIRYDGTAERTPFLYSNAAGLEDAMRDWDKKYHGDLWLAHYMFQLDQLYMRVPAQLGHQKVDTMSHWIVTAYPNTYYSRYLKKIASVKKTAANTSPSPSANVPTPGQPGIATPGPGSMMIGMPTPGPITIGMPTPTSTSSATSTSGSIIFGLPTPQGSIAPVKPTATPDT
jgi:hypothetical protein